MSQLARRDCFRAWKCLSGRASSVPRAFLLHDAPCFDHWFVVCLVSRGLAFSCTIRVIAFSHLDLAPLRCPSRPALVEQSTFGGIVLLLVLGGLVCPYGQRHESNATISLLHPIRFEFVPWGGSRSHLHFHLYLRTKHVSHASSLTRLTPSFGFGCIRSFSIHLSPCLRCVECYMR